MLLCGRINRLHALHVFACLFVCLSVRPQRAPNSNKKMRRKKIGANAEQEQTVCQFLAQRVKGQADGRTICRHWADVFRTVIRTVCCAKGDVAIMLNSGWSTLRVAIFQLISGATAIIGLYIGIAVSQVSTEAQQWILIIAAAMFLYVGLADVVSTASFHCQYDAE